MTDRVIQLHCAASQREAVQRIADAHETVAVWYSETNENRVLYHLLVEASRTQEIIDALQQNFAFGDDYHLLILPVEAYLPRPKETKDKEEVQKKEREQAKASILREELENSMVKNAAFDRTYILLVIFATLVAAIGMLENNVSVIVGAMVIAPFLSPNLALTFASVMGNRALAWRAVRTLLLGSAIAFMCGMLLGQFWPIDAMPYELSTRAQVDYSSIVLALAAGAAAVLSLTKGISSAMVGVMVAAALLPPLAASGVFLGHGHIASALSALLLLAVNIVCINLAGLLTFMMRGVGPRTWYEKREAKRSVYIYTAGWSAALVLLIGTIAGLNLLD